jgi:hypothetical protein
MPLEYDLNRDEAGLVRAMQAHFPEHERDVVRESVRRMLTESQQRIDAAPGRSAQDIAHDLMTDPDFVRMCQFFTVRKDLADQDRLIREGWAATMRAVGPDDIGEATRHRLMEEIERLVEREKRLPRLLTKEERKGILTPMLRELIRLDASERELADLVAQLDELSDMTAPALPPDEVPEWIRTRALAALRESRPAWRDVTETELSIVDEGVRMFMCFEDKSRAEGGYCRIVQERCAALLIDELVQELSRDD